MPFAETNGVRYYTFELLNAFNLPHAVFTRHGGVSAAPWHTLNVGSTVGDDPQHVVENRRRSFAALYRDPNSLFDVWQVHGADVVFAEAPRLPEEPHSRADVILTDNPAVTLYMRFADCVPILLYDPYKRVIGIVHAGWQGTVRKAAAVAVQAMGAHYGSRPTQIVAAIGPSIGPERYEVGIEVIQQVRVAFGDSAEALLVPASSPQKARLNLWEANRLTLQACGVRDIEIAGICTATHTHDWFSHRAEGGKTGRFGALIGLPQ